MVFAACHRRRTASFCSFSAFTARFTSERKGSKSALTGKGKVCKRRLEAQPGVHEPSGLGAGSFPCNLRLRDAPRGEVLTCSPHILLKTSTLSTHGQILAITTRRALQAKGLLWTATFWCMNACTKHVVKKAASFTSFAPQAPEMLPAPCEYHSRENSLAAAQSALTRDARCRPPTIDMYSAKPAAVTCQGLATW